MLKEAVHQENAHPLAVLAVPRHGAALTVDSLSKTTQQGVKEEELTLVHGGWYLEGHLSPQEERVGSPFPQKLLVLCQHGGLPVPAAPAGPENAVGR